MHPRYSYHPYRENPIPDECRVVRVFPDVEDEPPEVEGFHRDAIKLFKKCDIRFDSTSDVIAVVVCRNEVTGAISLGYSKNEYEGTEYLTFSFDVVVDENWRRKQIARELVQVVIKEARDVAQAHGLPGDFRVWVVNENVVPLLESFGFETEYGGWTEDRPHMYRSL